MNKSVKNGLVHSISAAMLFFKDENQIERLQCSFAFLFAMNWLLLFCYASSIAFLVLQVGTSVSNINTP